MLSIIIINPGLDSRARTALEPMLESVVRARGKVLRTNFSATSRVTRATKLTQAASRHSYRWCSPVRSKYSCGFPLERCKLLTRWAFEYFDQTGIDLATELLLGHSKTDFHCLL